MNGRRDKRKEKVNTSKGRDVTKVRIETERKRPQWDQTGSLHRANRMWTRTEKRKKTAQ